MYHLVSLCKSKLCYIPYINTDDNYKNIADDVKTRFDTANYELDILFPKRKKVTGLLKDKIGGKIMTEFVELRVETYSYLTDEGSEDKKSKSTKRYVVKRKRKTLLKLIFWRLLFFAVSSKYKANYGSSLKILSPKQMLSRLPIALAQVIAGDIS